MPTTESHADLKALQGQQRRIREQAQDLKNQVKELNLQIHTLSMREKDLNQRIENLTTKELVISEHAILRFLERSMGINLEDVKNAMMPESVKSQIDAFGDGQYPTPLGCKLRVKNRTVVTIID